MNLIKRLVNALRAFVRDLRIELAESQLAAIEKAAFRARRAGFLAFANSVTTPERVRALDAYNDARLLDDEADQLRRKIASLRDG